MLKINLINNYSHVLVLDNNFVYSKKNQNLNFRFILLINTFLKKYFNFFFNFNIEYINFFFSFKSIDIFISLSYKNNKLKYFIKNVNNFKKVKNSFLAFNGKMNSKLFKLSKNLDFLYYSKFKIFKINGLNFKGNNLQYLLNYNITGLNFKYKKFNIVCNSFFKNIYLSFVNILKNFLKLLCIKFSFSYKTIIINNINKLIILFFTIFFKNYNINKHFSKLVIGNVVRKTQLNSICLKKNKFLDNYILYLRLFYNYTHLKNYLKVCNLMDYNLLYFYNYILNFLFKFVLKNKNAFVFDFDNFIMFNNFNYIKKINVVYFKFYNVKFFKNNFKTKLVFIKNIFSFFNYRLYTKTKMLKNNDDKHSKELNAVDTIFFKSFNNKICFCFFEFDALCNDNIYILYNDVFKFKQFDLKKFVIKKKVKRLGFLLKFKNIFYKHFFSFKIFKQLYSTFYDFRNKKEIRLLLNAKLKNTFTFNKNKILFFIYYFYIVEKMYLLCSLNDYDIFKQLMCFFFNKFKIFNNFFYKFTNDPQLLTKNNRIKASMLINISKLKYSFDFYKSCYKTTKNCLNVYFDLKFLNIKRYNKNKLLYLNSIKRLTFNFYYNIKNKYNLKFLHVYCNQMINIYNKKLYIVYKTCFIFKLRKEKMIQNLSKIKIFKKYFFCSKLNINFNNVYISYLKNINFKKDMSINKNLYLLKFVYLNNVKFLENIDFTNFYLKKFLYYLNNLFLKYLFYIIFNFIFSSFYFINIYINLNIINMKMFSGFLNFIFSDNNYLNFLYFKSNYLKNLDISGFCGLYFLIYRYINNSNFVSGKVLSNYIYYIFLQKFRTNKVTQIRQDLHILKNIFEDFIDCNSFYKLLGFSISIKGRLSKRSQRKGILKISNGILSSNNLDNLLFKDKFYLNSNFGVLSFSITLNLKNLNNSFNFIK